jgi:hypothetical protein
MERLAGGLPCRCCLGILARDFGVPDELLENKNYYNATKELGLAVKGSGLQWTFNGDIGQINSSVSVGRVIAGINDSTGFGSDEVRVAEINKVANKNGVNFVFLKDK